jgi:hypothetical protein
MSKDIQQFKHHDLPKGPGTNRIVLMMKDPFWVFAYWECPQLEESKDMLLTKSKWGQAELVLRVYEVEGKQWSDSKPYKSFDIPVPDYADRWYIETGKPGFHFCVEIGLKNWQGDFYTLARSNIVWTPSNKISETQDTKWTPGKEMEHYSQQVAKSTKDNPSSLELINYAEKQMWQEASDSLFNLLKK